MENVSIIIPIYNEAKYVSSLIQTLSIQDFEHKYLELIFIDSHSDDNSVEIIERSMLDVDIPYCILRNSEKNVSKSLNMGIAKSKGDIIIRLDGHSEISNNYITMNVKYLKTTGAQNVGCIIETISTGIIGNAIAGVLSSPFGVGNSSFRIGSKNGFVDTVPFGCWWKKTFEECGNFDESLKRSEDNELNSRILKNGGKIYLFSDIKTIYHPRDSIISLVKMGYANGFEIIQTILKHPDNLRIRYLIPLGFVSFLIIGVIGSSFTWIIRTPFLVVLALYLGLDLVFSFVATKNRVALIRSGCLKFLIFPIFHICYGFGSVRGIFHYLHKKA